MVFKDKCDGLFYLSTHICTYIRTYSHRHTNTALESIILILAMSFVSFLSNLAIANAMFLVTTLWQQITA